MKGRCKLLSNNDGVDDEVKILRAELDLPGLTFGGSSAGSGLGLPVLLM